MEEMLDSSTDITKNSMRQVLMRKMQWTQTIDFHQILMIPSTYSKAIALFFFNESTTQEKQYFSFQNLSEIKLYTGEGAFLSKVSWCYEQLIQVAWTKDELLLCVCRGGVVRLFSVFGEMKHCFLLDVSIKKDEWLLAASIDTEKEVLGVITEKKRLFINTSLREYQNKLQYTLLYTKPITWFLMKFYKGYNLLHSNNFLFIETIDGFSVLQNSNYKHYFQNQKILQKEISSKGNYLAILLEKNTIDIYSLQESQSLDVIEQIIVPSNYSILKMAWIAERCVACTVTTNSLETNDIKETKIILCGFHSSLECIYTTTTPFVKLLCEADGLSVIEDHIRWFLQIVPSCISNLFSIKTKHPSAMLYLAYKKYKKGDIDSVIIIEKIIKSLPEALKDCLDAVCYEDNVVRCMDILKAVSFGRVYLKEYCDISKTITQHNIEKELVSPKKEYNKKNDLLIKLSKRLSKTYIMACQDLRVVHYIKYNSLHISLTVNQLRFLGKTTLLQILANRREYYLALLIAKSWGMTQGEKEPIIYTASHIDCSTKIQNICSSFWTPLYAPYCHQNSPSSSLFDVTRPLHTFLSVSQESVEKKKKNCPRTHHKKNYLPHASGASCLNFGINNDSQLSVVQEKKLQFKECLDTIIIQWIHDKIASSQHLSDEQLCHIMKSTLSNAGYFKSFILNIVFEAVQQGRPHLAQLILSYEPRSRVRVRILLRLADYTTALTQAIQNEDVDLVYECFPYIQTRHSQDPASDIYLPQLGTYVNSKLFALLRQSPSFYNFYQIIHIRQKKFHILKKLYEETNQFYRAAWICLTHAFIEKNETHSTELLAHAAAFFGSNNNNNDNNNNNSTTSTHSFQTLPIVQQLILDQIELQNLQKQWDSLAKKDKTWDTNTSSLHALPLYATVKQLLSRHRHKEVDILVKLFSIPQSRYLKLQIQTFIEHGMIDKLQRLAQSSETVQLVGGVDFFLSTLRYYEKTEFIERLMPFLKTSASTKKQWFPRVFHTFEPTDMKRVLTLLASSREETHEDGKNSISLPEEQKLLQGAATSFFGSVKNVFRRH